MAKSKFDGVVEAVHYTPEGQVAWVRAYLRRGQVFSDRVMMDRQTLIQHIKSGKRIMAGKRIPYMGASFEVSDSLRVTQKNDQDYLVIGNEQVDHDHLVGIPII
jgi:hypothetical protein